jgi:neopullulanase
MRNLTIIITLFLLQMNLTVKSQISRVEPPCWWAGMNYPELQLMIYGKNISGSSVDIKYKGITVKKITSPDNPDYLFVDLVLDPAVKPGTFRINLDKKGSKYSVEYTLRERKPDSAKREGFKNSDVIYLIVPDRFANGDPSNDEVPGMIEGKNRSDRQGRHGGDLKGITGHIDYIAKMGFTALWPTPVLENNQKRTSYHGYAITDFYRVDPRIGTNEEYAALGEKLRQNGIKLIMDMVFNHCGSEHWWMSDLPFPDWINNYPDIKITNHRRTVNQDPHASEYDRSHFSDGWFVHSMPDLNQRNPFMANYLIQNSIWWIEYAGLSGIRMDTYPYPDKDAMAEWTKRVLNEYPDFTMVGEEWSENPAIVSYWQRGKKNSDGYVSDLPSLMDFPVQSALVKALTEEESWGTGWIKLYETIAQDFLYPAPENLVVIPDNHDMARFFMQLGKDTALYKLGMTFILTTRGIPQIYYGSEIQMTHPKSNDHGDIRKDFPGGWEGDSVNAFTGTGLLPQQLQSQEFFRKLLIWRKNAEVMHTGQLMHFAPDNGCYVYFRYDNQNTVMIVLNKNSSPVELPLDVYHERLKDYSSAKDIISGKDFLIKDKLTAPGKTALVLELR